MAWFGGALTLLALATAPWLIIFFHPEGLWALTGILVDKSVDAPDNWALALRRSVIGSTVLAAAGFGCAAVGFFLMDREAPRN